MKTAMDWSPFRAVVDRHQTFAIATHVRPDADALGSELGLAHLLESLGKSVKVVSPSAAPASLHFLDPEKKVRQLGPEISLEEAGDVEVICIVDTSAWQQLQDFGKVMRASAATRVVIDHHVSSDDLGALVLKDTQREATGSMIAELHQTWGIAPPPHIATALYAAIATDTGWFRFPATNAETMRTAAWLMDHGAQPDQVYRQLYEQVTVHRAHLAGRVLSRVAVDCGGKLAHTFVRYEDFGELGASAPDTEDLVNDCLRIAGTKAAFIAVELANRHTKVSLRSRSGVNVAEIAEKFGGGGHKLAAGATLPPPFAAAHAQILSAMRDAATALAE